MKSANRELKGKKGAGERGVGKIFPEREDVC